MSETETEGTMIAIRIPSYLVTRLKDLAERNDRSLSAEVRIAIRKYVEATA